MGGNPAPEPIVLRGHGGDVQCVAFATLGGVECLLSGDSNGDVVAWDLALRRPLWRLAAHPPSSGVLSVEAMPGGASSGPGDASERGETSTTRVLTQGRDGTLKCWRASGADAPSPDPAWSVTSGSFHFCRFATWCRDAAEGTLRALAVVGAETSAVDVLAVREGDAPDEPPSCARTFRVRTSDDAGGETGKLGTVMACAFVTPCEALRNNSAPLFFLVVGYEEGTVALWDASDLENDEEEEEEEGAKKKESKEPLWRERVHGDAVTSVAADATRGGFVSAAADGGVLRFAIRPSRRTMTTFPARRTIQKYGLSFFSRTAVEITKTRSLPRRRKEAWRASPCATTARFSRRAGGTGARACTRRVTIRKRENRVGWRRWVSTTTSWRASRSEPRLAGRARRTLGGSPRGHGTAPWRCGRSFPRKTR
jgi:WD40 repeat protein